MYPPHVSPSDIGRADASTPPSASSPSFRDVNSTSAFGFADSASGGSTSDYQQKQVASRKRKSSSSRGNASQERSKITRACDLCKLKKTRCSGTLPCERCTKLSLQCDYKSTYLRGSPPSPLVVPSTPGGSQFKTDVTAPRDTSITAVLPSRQDIPINQAPPDGLNIPRQSRGASSRNSPERGATDFEGQYLGPASGESFLNRAWKRLNQDYTSNIRLEMQQASPQNASVFAFGDSPFSEPTEENFTLPTRPRIAELVSIYFGQAIVTYHCLHRGTLEKWIEELIEKGVNPAERPSPVMTARAAVILMVFAIATLNEQQNYDRNDITVNHDKGERWFAAAKHMMAMETGAPRLEMIQARLMQCLYLLSSSRANQCWYTFGTTVHLIMALGLHRRKHTRAAEVPGAYIEIECQKRVFWSAYIVDRYLSVILGRPRTLNDEDIDQELPDEINDEDMTPNGPKPTRSFGDCTESASIHHAKLARIVGEISREIYTIRPIPESVRLDAAERLAAKLEDWRHNLPPIFRNVRSTSLAPPFRRQNHVLYVAYAHAVILTTRSFLLSTFSDLVRRPAIPEEKVLIHTKKCVEAAQSIIEIVNNLAENRPISQAFWFTHYASFCAVIVAYIYIIQQHRPRRLNDFENAAAAEGLNDLLIAAEKCQRYLAEATIKNSPSRRYSIILEELRQEVHRQIDPPLSQHQENSSGGRTRHDLSIASVMEANPQQPQGGAGATTSLPLQSDILSYPNGASMDAMAGMAPQGGLFENWDSMGWAQLDSWAYSNIGEETADAVWFSPQ